MIADSSSGHGTLLAATGALLLAAWLPASAQDLEKCEAPVGTLAVVEPQGVTIRALARYDLDTPTPVLRRMVQESGCFIVVERGTALRSMQQERALARGGDLTRDANVGAGQMQAADFYLTPDVIFSVQDAGGVGAAVGSLLGRRVGAIAGGLKFKEAKTSILISATRSGVQIASAEGEARKADFALGALSVFGGALGAAGGYTNTDEGKVILASFVDNYNNVVQGVRANPNLPPLTPEEVRVVMTGEAAATGGFEEGDVVAPKIDNIEIYSAPDSEAGVLTRVTRSDLLVFLGAEENGFLLVQSPEGAGWIRKVLVTESTGGAPPPSAARGDRQTTPAYAPADHAAPGLSAGPGRFAARVSGPRTVTFEGAAGFAVQDGALMLSLGAVSPSGMDDAMLMTRLVGGRPAPGTYPIGDFLAGALGGNPTTHFSGWGGAHGMEFRSKSGTIRFTSSSPQRLEGWMRFDAVDSNGEAAFTVEASFDARCSPQTSTGCS